MTGYQNQKLDYLPSKAIIITFSFKAIINPALISMQGNGHDLISGNSQTAIQVNKK